MKLIVGLGNPGPKYAPTRHNVGHHVVQALGEVGNSAKIHKTTVFMNSSGEEVARFVHFYKLTPQDLLVIHDDMDVPFGETRLQFGRSSAGHHGVDSIIDALGTNKFWRLRIGIGNRCSIPGDQFVIDRFSSVEEKELPQVIKEAAELARTWLRGKS